MATVERREDTWACLLPADAEFLSERTNDCKRGDSPLVLVAGELSQLVDDELHQVDAVVCSRVGSRVRAQLQEAGLNEMRRLIAIPSNTAPRFFIPVEPRPLARASASLYRPNRVRARWLAAFLRAIARSGLLDFVPSQVTIAMRVPPALEQALAELSGEASVRIAFFCGTEGPPRKPTAIALGPDGRVLAVAKIAINDISRQLVQHEAEILGTLSSLSGLSTSCGRRRIPELLAFRDIDGRQTLVQSPIEGGPSPRKWTAAHDRFVDGLSHGSPRPVVASEVVTRLRAAASSGAVPVRLGDGLRRACQILGDTHMQAVVNHGDCAPWNLVCQSDGEIGAFDWEYGILDGIPMLDRVHFVLSVGSLLQGWKEGELLDGVLTSDVLRSTSVNGTEVGPALLFLSLSFLGLQRRRLHGPDDPMGNACLNMAEFASVRLLRP